MFCAKIKNGSLGGVYGRHAAWHRRWAITACLAGGILLAALSLAGSLARLR